MQRTLNSFWAATFAIVFILSLATSTVAHAQSVSTQCWLIAGPASPGTDDSQDRYYVSKIFNTQNGGGPRSEKNTSTVFEHMAGESPESGPYSDAFSDYFHAQHPDLFIGGYVFCDSPDDHHKFIENPVQVDWPPSRQQSASRFAAPARVGGVAQKPVVNECLVIVEEPGQYAPSQLRNRCAFPVTFAFCYDKPGSMYDCAPTSPGSADNKGGMASLAPGALHSLDQYTGGEVRWLACKGNPGDVGPVFGWRDGALRGHCQ